MNHIKNILKRFTLLMTLVNYYRSRKTSSVSIHWERDIFKKAEYFLANDNKWTSFQEQYLRDLLSYARSHSAYFKSIMPEVLPDGATIKDFLVSLPLLSKNIIREQQSNIFSDEVTTNTGWANTGGSTGEPLRFPCIYSNLQIEAICQAILYIKMTGKSKVGLIVSIDGTRINHDDVKRNIYWQNSIFNFPYGQYAMSTLYMNNDTLPYYISFLNQVKPEIMRGYPSGVMELARYCKNNNVDLEFKPKGIYLTSENFGIDEEEIISEVFDCPVYGQYGNTEASVFAIKKPKSIEYICLPIYGFTEVLNSDGNHVKKGEMGEIVVTGFNHLGIPFIRYKTGDYAVFGGITENGSVILSSLLGRSIDYMFNREGKKIFLVGFIFGGHLEAFNYIAKWQIEQKIQGSVVMKIVKGDGYNDKIEKEIIYLFEREKISVSICYLNEIEKTKRGKAKFMIQHITQ